MLKLWFDPIQSEKNNGMPFSVTGIDDQGHCESIEISTIESDLFSPQIHLRFSDTRSAGSKTKYHFTHLYIYNENEPTTTFIWKLRHRMFEYHCRKMHE